MTQFFDLTKSETAKIEARANYGANIVIITQPANENGLWYK